MSVCSFDLEMVDLCDVLGRFVSLSTWGFSKMMSLLWIQRYLFVCLFFFQHTCIQRIRMHWTLEILYQIDSQRLDIGNIGNAQNKE